MAVKIRRRESITRMKRKKVINKTTCRALRVKERGESLSHHRPSQGRTRDRTKTSSNKYEYSYLLKYK